MDLYFCFYCHVVVALGGITVFSHDTILFLYRLTRENTAIVAHAQNCSCIL